MLHGSALIVAWIGQIEGRLESPRSKQSRGKLKGAQISTTESAAIEGRERSILLREAERLAGFVMFSRRSCLLPLSKELNRGNISFSQFFLLGSLAKEKHLTMGDISETMGQSTAAATGLVDRLEKLEYVQRPHDTGTRSNAVVQITPKGLGLVERMSQDLVADLVACIEELSLERRQGFFDVNGGTADADEEQLIAEVVRGLPKEFWIEYHALKEMAERSELSEDGANQLASMAIRIEEADADRLSAAAKLSKQRGVPFDEVVAEFEIGLAVH